MRVIHVDNLHKEFRLRRKAEGAWWRRMVMPAAYDTLHAVNGISFDINSGERVAFIGPNGAGKSTTLKMLSGILWPTQGQADVDGLVPWKQRRELAYRIGVVFGQRGQLWPELTARDGFHLLGKIYGVESMDYRQRLAALSETFHIGALLDQTVRQMSLGQRMRCEIVASLLHQPSVLFLDEPSIGLDVSAKVELRDLLKTLSRDQGLTLLLTSHDTGDIEEICDRVILIDHGRKVLDLPLAQLKRDYVREKRVRLITAEPAPSLPMAGVTARSAAPHQLDLVIDTTKSGVEPVISAALAQFGVRDLVIEDPPLESIILHIYASTQKDLAS